jgi:hypothetical protein
VIVRKGLSSFCHPPLQFGGCFWKVRCVGGGRHTIHVNAANDRGRSPVSRHSHFRRHRRMCLTSESCALLRSSSWRRYQVARRLTRHKRWKPRLMDVPTLRRERKVRDHCQLAGKRRHRLSCDRDRMTASHPAPHSISRVESNS